MAERPESDDVDVCSETDAGQVGAPAEPNDVAADPVDPDAVTVLAFATRACAVWPLIKLNVDDVRAAGAELDVIDIEQQPAAAVDRSIVSIPTVIVARGGNERRRLVGAMSSNDILAAVRSVVDDTRM